MNRPLHPALHVFPLHPSLICSLRSALFASLCLQRFLYLTSTVYPILTAANCDSHLDSTSHLQRHLSYLASYTSHSIMSRTQQDQFIDDDEEETCPLCVEEFDLGDKHFRPCPCGYQVLSHFISLACVHITNVVDRYASSVTTTYETT